MANRKKAASARDRVAVNKPVGDNARKGAVKKRSQTKTTLGGAAAWTKRNKGSGEFTAVKKRRPQGRHPLRNLRACGSRKNLGPVIHAQVRAMDKCNRKAPKTSLEDRLFKFADEVRAAAGVTPPGLERDRLIRKAEKAEGSRRRRSGAVALVSRGQALRWERKAARGIERGNQSLA